jgi:hypothetical protein
MFCLNTYTSNLVPRTSNLEPKKMFSRKLIIERIDATGHHHPCPIAQLDNFAMRNFTNDAVFDDTLPIADGLLEAGARVPLDRLTSSMEDWFRRKSYFTPTDRLHITEVRTHPHHAASSIPTKSPS